MLKKPMAPNDIREIRRRFIFVSVFPYDSIQIHAHIAYMPTGIPNTLEYWLEKAALHSCPQELFVSAQPADTPAAHNATIPKINISRYSGVVGVVIVL